MKIQKVELENAIQSLKTIDKDNSIIGLKKDGIIGFNDLFFTFYKIELPITETLYIDGILLLKFIQTKVKDDLEIIQGENNIVFKSKNRKATLKIIDIEFKYQEFFKEIKNNKWKDIPSNFVDGLKECLPVVSNNKDLKGLTAFYLFRDKIIASDEVRISKYSLDQIMTKKPILIPKKTGKNIIGNKYTQYMFLDNYIVFRGNNILFISKILDSNIPPFFGSEGYKKTIIPAFKQDWIDFFESKDDFNNDFFDQLSIQGKGKILIIQTKSESGNIREVVKNKVSWKGNVVLKSDIFKFCLNISKKVMISKDQTSVYVISDCHEHIASLTE